MMLDRPCEDPPEPKRPRKPNPEKDPFEAYVEDLLRAAPPWMWEELFSDEYADVDAGAR